MLLSMNLTVDGLIDAVNQELEAGNWSQVVSLTAALYEAAVEYGDAQLAELVQDLHWIANDALAYPFEVATTVCHIRS